MNALLVQHDTLYVMCIVHAVPNMMSLTAATVMQMLGFVWGVAVERFQNRDLFTQVQSSPALIAAVVALITVASAVPFYKGLRRSGNPIFTADAELWNGRLAMVCLCPKGIPFLLRYFVSEIAQKWNISRSKCGNLTTLWGVMQIGVVIMIINTAVRGKIF